MLCWNPVRSGYALWELHHAEFLVDDLSHIFYVRLFIKNHLDREQHLFVSGNPLAEILVLMAVLVYQVALLLLLLVERINLRYASL